MLSIAGTVLTYTGIVITFFLIWAALSPFEVMGWWAGWFGETLYREDIPSEDGLVRAVRQDTDSYVVFMSGIGRVSNAFGGTPTTIHLHYEIRQTSAASGTHRFLRTCPWWLPTRSSLASPASLVR